MSPKLFEALVERSSEAILLLDAAGDAERLCSEAHTFQAHVGLFSAPARLAARRLEDAAREGSRDDQQATLRELEGLAQRLLEILLDWQRRNAED